MIFFRQLAIIFLTTTTCVTAQDFSSEINRDVWKPFCEALINLDTTRYLSVHSKQLIRAERSNGKVYGFTEYANQTKAGFEQAKVNKQKSPNVKFSMELRFLERVASTDRAYEIGYYKSSLQLADGSVTNYYSQFYVSLVKENGAWKILTDSSQPLPHLPESEFQKAQTL
jgi:hypothetical protein